MRTAYFLILALLFGCSDRRPPENSTGRAPDNRDQIESIDISSDDKKVLLLSTREGGTTVFEVNTDGQSPRQILKPSSDAIFSNPRYSPDGKKIVFIKHLKKVFGESTVCVSNSDGTNVKELTPGGELVTEAVFSAQGNDILYCTSKQYNTSKKKRTTDVRRFDIYAVNINDKQTRQLSKLNAVGIDNLSEINEKYLLFHLTSGKKSGIYSLEKDNPSHAQKIFPDNGTQESNELDKPGYVPDRFVVFTARAELYAMDMTSRKAALVYDAKGGHFIQMLAGFHTQSRVLFKKFDEPGLTSVNTDGSDVKSIDIEFP
jgi:Tol biopolymer transport system component